MIVLTVVAMMYEECFDIDAFLSENKEQKITHSQTVAVAAVAKKKQKKAAQNTEYIFASAS